MPEPSAATRYDERPESPWPWVEIREGFWYRFIDVLFVPIVLPIYLVLTLPVVLWTACACILDGAFGHRINWWSPAWEGTAYYEARWRKLGGSRG